MTENNSSKHNIVFISWKDIANPASGGAEIVHQELSKRLVQDGHTVTHLVPGFGGGKSEEYIDGVRIIRVGNNVLSFYGLPFYFAKHLKKETDILIDCFNCFGSFAWLFFRNSIFFIHHIQDSIWWWQTEFSGVPRWFMYILNPVGFVVEKIQLLLTGLFFKGQVFTISQSTSDDLQKYAFSPKRIIIVPECAIESRLEKLEPKSSYDANNSFVVVHIGMRKMKRPLEALKAFEIFQRSVPSSQLIMMSGGGEIEILKQYAADNSIKNVEFTGRVTEEQKFQHLRKAHVLIATAVKEGWGLIVTEANSVGTPAVTYNVAGLRDSNLKGIVSQSNSPESLAESLSILYKDRELYQKTRQESWNYSSMFTFQNSYLEFSKQVLGNNL